MIRLLVLISLLLSMLGCKGAAPEQSQEGEGEMAIQLSSTAFSEGKTIPNKYTCDGSNVSPQLAWTGLPVETKSLALVMDDPDAPGRTFVHWVLYNLRADLSELPEGSMTDGVMGTNSYRKTMYNGPCPPPGSAHRYYFKLYALDSMVELTVGASKDELEKAMQGHILAWGQLMGKYVR